MGPGPTPPAGPTPSLARANGAAALTLLAALMHSGLRRLVLCPGSRSAPLAVAAALLEPHGLAIHTGIDERSAAFLALGLSRGDGIAAAVVTTSGTAVAELLPAAVEADLGAIPLLLISADRPARLKGCGANQAVPQEGFLVNSCRCLLQGAPDGVAGTAPDDLLRLAQTAMAHAGGEPGRCAPGPVHLNLPFEEPLHGDAADLLWLEDLASSLLAQGVTHDDPASSSPARVSSRSIPRLEASRPGVVVAGPWRGTPADWAEHLLALRRWQEASGWPVLADPLSGLRGLEGLHLIAGYDLILSDPPQKLTAPQVLRLGSLPASRRLQSWLEQQGGPQVLISPGDPRRLDPLGTVNADQQWSCGLASWLSGQSLPSAPEDANLQLAERWSRAEARAQAILDRELIQPQA
ncbi:MAG: 2-succinyl-5-enolpyruvyl-6-hydroxy-3-cyclohexene-1-carboxylic-acid synthase, partial [Synechococcus sp. ELA057]